MKTFRPVESSLETKNLPEASKQRIRWYALIKQAEHISEHYGLGLAETWRHIHAGDYGQAQASLENTLDYWGDHIRKQHWQTETPRRVAVPKAEADLRMEPYP